MNLSWLDTHPGLGVEKAIRNRFDQPVTNGLGSGQKDFFLLASFGHCVFRLSLDSVSTILNATLGGVLDEFRPVQLADRVFKFSVSCKSVGFHIYNLWSYECQ